MMLRRNVSHLDRHGGGLMEKGKQATGVMVADV